MLGVLPHFLAQELFQARPLLCLNQVWNQPALQGKWCLETKTQVPEVLSVNCEVITSGLAVLENRAVQTLPLIGGDQGGKQEEDVFRIEIGGQMSQRNTHVHTYSYMCMCKPCIHPSTSLYEPESIWMLSEPWGTVKHSPFPYL